MSIPKKKLPLGAYETLITESLSRSLANHTGHVGKDKLDKAEGADRLTHHLAGLLKKILGSVPAAKRPTLQAELANRFIEFLDELGHDSSEEKIIDPPQILRLLTTQRLPGQAEPVLPDVPLMDHDLLANAPGEPAFAHALGTELPTADRVDAVIAFVRWTGLNLIRSQLAELVDRGVPVRLLTTTFTGSTERKALDWLVEQGVEVKVSYDTRTTRLHAKAWLIHRDSGYSTAYVGSSNLSRSALVDGIEWNVRLAQATAPAVLNKLCATFDSLWHDDSFERYNPTEDAERFDDAIRRTRTGASSTGVSGLDVRPWHYQRDMLEALLVERQRFKRMRNLVVAPTGTGKTVVAALDYKALKEGCGGIDKWNTNRSGSNPSLLFIAHRDQILEQSLQTFRDVLKNGSFGEKLVGGFQPQHWQHVFASVQSLNAMKMESIDPAQFDIVYIDEFHHAQAPTYRRVMDYLKPYVMIGLTATPERSDGSNVRDLFGGHYAFDMRLWDALDQQLLSPFHYYGVADGTNLKQLQWERGGYRTADLEGCYVVSGHDARTAKVLTALEDKVADVRQMRAIGFCVSVKHAHYMAKKFSDHGIASVAMDGSTPSVERQRMLDSLRGGEVNVVFAVDVLSEGVDIPEVDTILLLRPTESATVFLQQLGRGLRLHDSKDVCTVLDFIGQQHNKFRSDFRLRAMTGRSRGQLVKDVGHGFPFLPSGCHIQLDRQSEAHLLENLKAVATPSTRVLANELASLEERLGCRVSLNEFCEATLTETDDIYRRTSWTELRRKAGVAVSKAGPREEEMSKALRLRLQEIDDPERLAILRQLGQATALPDDVRSQRIAAMLGFILFKDGDAPNSVPGVVDALSGEPEIQAELLELSDVLEVGAKVLTKPYGFLKGVPLHVHGTYSRSEILVALGDRKLGESTRHREGVKYVKAHNATVLFVTLEKSERDYSPTTRYKDYALSRELFHWESQSVTTRQMPTGQRLLNNTSTVLLFVRHTNKDTAGRAPGFVFLGPVKCVDSKGEKPISIVWRLETPMPEKWFGLARAVG